MNYRLGTMADLDRICELIEAAKCNMVSQGMYQWDEVYPIRSDFENDIKMSTLYVAEEADELIAIYVVSEEADEAYSKCTWENDTETACVLHRFCVSPKYQNRGIGKQILKAVEAQFSLKYKSMRLDVFSENPYALSLYKNNGYEERGLADWRKGRFILMEKALHECVFCHKEKLVTDIIYEDELVMAFMDMDPINEGHVLVVPKEHFLDADEMPDELLAHISIIAKKIVAALKNVYQPDGYSIMQNGGEFNDVGHYHMHIFPRYRGDGFGWKYSEESRKVNSEIANRLKEAIKNNS